jgi:hypothetical protein
MRSLLLIAGTLLTCLLPLDPDVFTPFEVPFFLASPVVEPFSFKAVEFGSRTMISGSNATAKVIRSSHNPRKLIFHSICCSLESIACSLLIMIAHFATIFITA